MLSRAITRQLPVVESSVQRWMSSSSTSKGKKGFRPRRRPGSNYRGPPPAMKKSKKAKGPKEPNDISIRPRIDLSNIRITDVPDGEEQPITDLGELGPLAAAAMQMTRRDDMDIETQLKMMDYFTSAPGSTEDLVGERRALAFDLGEGQDRESFLAEMDRIVEQESLDYLELPKSDYYTEEEFQKKAANQDGVTDRIPPNQLAHGEWGEQLIRTDRVAKMWRGGRIESFRSLVIAGNLRGCGGFGVGKAFEAEDAVEIACRMARRNIFFVDRYRNRGLTRDLVGRQNSCKMYLRATDNGLRGNPLACEILKLMGITNVVAKAHGARNHYNVVRATFKALQTHESLDDIAMKRGVRLINLQKAKHLQI